MSENRRGSSHSQAKANKLLAWKYKLFEMTNQMYIFHFLFFIVTTTIL